jgi:hypothetical protein
MPLVPAILLLPMVSIPPSIQTRAPARDAAPVSACRR